MARGPPDDGAGLAEDLGREGPDEDLSGRCPWRRIGHAAQGPDWPASFTVNSQTNPIIVDFWTINGGTTVFAKYHGLFD